MGSGQAKEVHPSCLETEPWGFLTLGQAGGLDSLWQSLIPQCILVSLFLSRAVLALSQEQPYLACFCVPFLPLCWRGGGGSGEGALGMSGFLSEQDFLVPCSLCTPGLFCGCFQRPASPLPSLPPSVVSLEKHFYSEFPLPPLQRQISALYLQPHPAFPLSFRSTHSTAHQILPTLLLWPIGALHSYLVILRLWVPGAWNSTWSPPPLHSQE